MSKIEIENSIRERLGDSLRECSVVMIGEMAEVSVSWTDGLSVPHLRQWCIENIPLLYNITVDREISSLADVPDGDYISRYTEFFLKDLG